MVALRFDPTTVASSSGDGSLRLWSLETGKQLDGLQLAFDSTTATITAGAVHQPPVFDEDGQVEVQYPGQGPTDGDEEESEGPAAKRQKDVLSADVAGTAFAKDVAGEMSRYAARQAEANESSAAGVSKRRTNYANVPLEDSDVVLAGLVEERSAKGVLVVVAHARTHSFLVVFVVATGNDGPTVRMVAQTPIRDLNAGYQAMLPPSAAAAAADSDPLLSRERLAGTVRPAAVPTALRPSVSAEAGSTIVSVMCIGEPAVDSEGCIVKGPALQLAPAAPAPAASKETEPEGAGAEPVVASDGAAPSEAAAEDMPTHHPAMQLSLFTIAHAGEGDAVRWTVQRVPTEAQAELDWVSALNDASDTEAPILPVGVFEDEHGNSSGNAWRIGGGLLKHHVARKDMSDKSVEK